MQRGEIWWANLGTPRGSAPGSRRPVLVIQANPFNRSRIQTVLVVAITSNLELASAPGNVLIPRREAGLSRDSVVNVSQVITLDRDALTECVGSLTGSWLHRVEEGLRLALGL